LARRDWRRRLGGDFCHATPTVCRNFVDLHGGLCLAKTQAGGQVVDLLASIRRESRLVITLLLHLLRLLPFLVGGHRQLALENLALRQQLAIYKRTLARPQLRTTDRLFWAASPDAGLVGGRPWSSCRPTPSCDGSAAASARVLDPALGSAQRRPPSHQRRDRRPDQENGGGESLVRCAPHPRGAPEARPQRGRRHRLAAAPQAALPALSDLAGVSRQPRPRLGLNRLLHRAHRSPARPLRPRRARSPPPADRPLQRDRASHCGLDRFSSSSTPSRTTPRRPTSSATATQSMARLSGNG
jgi:hypothetical protein